MIFKFNYETDQHPMSSLVSMQRVDFREELSFFLQPITILTIQVKRLMQFIVLWVTVIPNLNFR